TVVLGVVLASLAIGLALADGPRGARPRAGRGTAQAQHRDATPRVQDAIPRDQLAGLDLPQLRTDRDRLVSDLPGGKVARLTLASALQADVEGVLQTYDVPWGALVAIEPSTGRVLAYASHSSANPGSPDLALDATPPAASVFKIITGSALVDA